MKFKYILLAYGLLAVSCSQKLDLTDHFDPSSPFEINQMDKSGPEFSKIIDVNELKHKKLASWIKSNNNGWSKTDHDTHAGMIIVRQDEFRILLYRNNDFVIVGIDAKGNDMHQYKKDMDSNELMFLVDE